MPYSVDILLRMDHVMCQVTAACLRVVVQPHGSLQDRESCPLSPRTSTTGHTSRSCEDSSPKGPVVSQEAERRRNTFQSYVATPDGCLGPSSHTPSSHPRGGSADECQGESVGGADSNAAFRKECGLSASLSTGSPHHAHLLPRRAASDDLRLKRASPCDVSEDGERSLWEVWVASSNARHSTLTVIDYAQSFSTIEVGKRLYV